MLKLPKAWTNAQQNNRVQASVKATVDGIDLTGDAVNQGLCPVTKQPMERMIANGHEVWVSIDEGIVLPIKD